MDKNEAIKLMNEAMKGRLPDLMGIELIHIGKGEASGRMKLRADHMAPNDFLHAGTVITLADSCCGMGCIATLPEGATGFTTMELKANFLRTAEAGALICNARVQHAGSRTQVWDAEVLREDDGKTLALFRCTQMLLADEDPRTKRQRERVTDASP